jgi:mono/diheme cytochrome c family protein
MTKRCFFTFLLIGLLAGCSGLAGEPEIVATFVAPTPAVEDNAPAQPPDLANGARIFAARCTSCHGANGAGDGELVASGQVQNPGNFREGASAQGQTPQQWYNTITNGRIENLMPPWRDSLTAQERWDVAMYTYTLHYTPEQIAQGQTLAQANITDLTAFADQALMSATSDMALQTMLAQNAAIGALDAAGQQAVTAYVRTLSLANSDQASAQAAQNDPLQTPEVSDGTAEAGVVQSGVVTGTVTNGTAGFGLPENFTVRLHAFDGQTPQDTREMVVAPDGTYRFEDVPMGAGWAYFVSAPYNERQFASSAAEADLSDLVVELPITVYELTEDIDAIRVVATVIQVSPAPTNDGLEVVQFIRYENTSDRLFTTTQGLGDGRYLSLVVSLPPASVVLGLDSVEQRYVVLDEPAVMVDTLPVLPGDDHIIQLAYFIPYTNGAIIEQQMNYAVEGTVRVLIEGDQLQLTSEQMQDIGPQEVGDQTLRGFGGTLTLARPGVLRYELRGSLTQTSVLSGDRLLAFGLIGVGVVILVGVAAYSLLRRRAPRTPDKSRMIDVLVQQIAELDDAHAQGKINHDVYQRQRADLKGRLSALMGESASRE